MKFSWKHLTPHWLAMLHSFIRSIDSCWISQHISAIIYLVIFLQGPIQVLCIFVIVNLLILSHNSCHLTTSVLISGRTGCFSLLFSLLPVTALSPVYSCKLIIICMKVKVKLLSHVRLFMTLWTAYQAPLSMEFSRQEYWIGFPFPSPGDFSRPRDWTWVSDIAGRHCHLSHQ